MQSKEDSPSLPHPPATTNWCSLGCHCSSLHGSVPQDWQILVSSTISPAQMQDLAFICWISWGSCQPISLARRNSLYGIKLICKYFVTDSVLENAIFDRVCYSPSLSVHLSLPTKLKSLILIFLSCRFSHQAFLMPFRHYAHKVSNSYSLYYSGPWHRCRGNLIFLLFTSFSALISLVLDMEIL